MKKINTKVYGSSKFNGALNRIIGKIKAEADKVPAIKEKTDKLVIDSTTGTMTINSGIDVGTQGDVTVGRDLYVEDEIVIDSLAKIVDTDGNQLKVTAGDINSGTATNGQVLKANGSGGVNWGDAGGGMQLYGHNIEVRSTEGGSYEDSYIRLFVIDTKSDRYTKTTFKNKYLSTSGKVFPATGAVRVNIGGEIQVCPVTGVGNYLGEFVGYYVFDNGYHLTEGQTSYSVTNYFNDTLVTL